MIVQKVVKRFTRNLAKDDFRSLLASQTVFHVDTALGHNEGEYFHVANLPTD